MRTLLLLTLTVLPVAALAADAPDCKDPPVLKRLPAYEIQSCEAAEDAATFPLATSENCDAFKQEDVEGAWLSLAYAVKDGQDAASAQQVQKHFVDAWRAQGGTVVLEAGTQDAGKAACMDGNLYDRLAVGKLVKGGKETWAMVAPGSQSYQVYIERTARK